MTEHEYSQMYYRVVFSRTTAMKAYVCIFAPTLLCWIQPIWNPIHPPPPDCSPITTPAVFKPRFWMTPPPHPRVQHHYSVHGDAKYMTPHAARASSPSSHRIHLSMTVIRCDRFLGCQKMKAYTHV